MSNSDGSLEWAITTGGTTNASSLAMMSSTAPSGDSRPMRALMRHTKLETISLFLSRLDGTRNLADNATRSVIAAANPIELRHQKIRQKFEEIRMDPKPGRRGTPAEQSRHRRNPRHLRNRGRNQSRQVLWDVQ